MRPAATGSTAAAAFVLLATGCAPQAPTGQGQSIGGLYTLFSIVAIAIFSITAGLIAWSIIRYRARPGDDELPAQTHTKVGLEILWFAIPQVIVIGLFIFSVIALGDVDPEKTEPGVTVEVEAFRWGWRFTYVDEGLTVSGTAENHPEMVLPTDEKIVFLLKSNDVIHSFYVPEFLMKRDAIPGRDNRLEVTIEEEGIYDGKCAEFCGLLHGDMNFTIRAMLSSDFEQWVTQQQESGNGNG
jgi:cytochrome c oxidase subunit 2